LHVETSAGVTTRQGHIILFSDLLDDHKTALHVDWVYSVRGLTRGFARSIATGSLLSVQSVTCNCNVFCCMLVCILIWEKASSKFCPDVRLIKLLLVETVNCLRKLYFVFDVSLLIVEIDAVICRY